MHLRMDRPADESGNERPVAVRDIPPWNMAGIFEHSQLCEVLGQCLNDLAGGLHRGVGVQLAHADEGRASHLTELVAHIKLQHRLETRCIQFLVNQRSGLLLLLGTHGPNRSQQRDHSSAVTDGSPW